MPISIKKVKLKDGHPEIEYFEDHKRGGKSIKAECNAPAHQDLKDALAKLDVHVAILCEQVTDRALFDPSEQEAKLLTKITCTGFSIGGNDEHEGVTLIGRREMKNNRVLNLVSPFQKWEDENAPYKHSWELKRAVNGCISEVELYLFEDKYAPDLQGELFTEEAEAETATT